MQAAQAFKPCLAVLSPRQSTLSRQVTPLPRWAVLVLSQEQMQAMKVLNPRLAAHPPETARAYSPQAGCVGAQSQYTSASPQTSIVRCLRQAPLGLSGILPQKRREYTGRPQA